MLQFDLIEKFGWTVYDFIFQRPRKFFNMRAQNSKRYMGPMTFAFTNFVLYETILTFTVKFLSNYWDWNKVIALPANYTINIPTNIDLSAILYITGAANLCFYIIGASWVKLAAMIVKRKILFKDALISICYSSASNILAIVYLGLVLFIVFCVGTMYPHQRINDLGRVLWYGFQTLLIISSYYLIDSVSSISKISFGRLLVGFILSYIIWFLLIIILTFIIILIYYYFNLLLL